MPDAFRLPRTVEPQHYELTLTPDLAAATFAGEERVRVLVHEPTTEVVLNAAELDIHSAGLVDDDGNKLSGTVALDEERERATITLDGTAQPGHWTLFVTFTGTLNDKLRGFYRSTFTDDDGNEQVIGTTQFEAPHARRAFPCWDEPGFKAVFAIRLIVDEDLTAISNGAEVETVSLGNGKKQVEFTDTIRMSTYLVAFIVGPLELTAPRMVDGVPLRVAHVPGKAHLTDFALEVGEHSLRFFTDYFGLPYPSDKLDLIALPDFAFGAMENLGAVTFRETALLVDTEHSSRGELERVADVVAHEIAHMWFGDLVTMKWWNGIWLNEAFATFMELACVDAFRPEWDRWVSFGIERNAAFTVDALCTTRPVEYPVGPPEEAEAMFDVLTYQKGSAVLRMLERYLGAEPFRQGIAHYLAKHSYGNTETTDLWDDIEEASGEPVRALMDSWIFQGGYPVVYAALADEPGQLELSQRRFAFRPDALPADQAGARWIVPVLLRTGDGQHQRVLLSDESARVSMSTEGAVVANDGGWGFFRVQYSADLLDRLTGHPVELTPLERFTVVSDGWALARAGMGEVADFVKLVRRFRDEDDANVWMAMVGPLGFLDRVVGAETRASVQAFVRELAGPALASVGWDRKPGEDERIRPLRSTLVEALGLVGADPEVRRRAAEMQAVALHDRDALDPDLAGPIARIVARNGGEAEYTEFLDIVRHPTTPQEEIRYLYALAEFENPGLVRRTLDLALTEVRTQNGPFLVSALFANRVGGEPTWEFVKEHWADLNARFPDNLIPRMLQGTTNLMKPDVAADVAAFVEAQPRLRHNKLAQQTVEQLQINVAFAGREAGIPPDVFT
jgi:puromycin-sensitive aminopeptidase